MKYAVTIISEKGKVDPITLESMDVRMRQISNLGVMVMEVKKRTSGRIESGMK
jgi:hypothetical protein